MKWNFNLSILVFLTMFLISCGGGGDDGLPDDFGKLPPADISNKIMSVDERSTTAIRLGWDFQSSASLYKIYRNGSLIATETNRSFMDTNLTSGTSYLYKYSIVESGVESSYSLELIASTLPSPATLLPAAPSTPKLDTKTATTIEVEWLDSSDNEDGFKVKRDGLLIATIPFGTESSFKDTGLTPDTSYNYSITAYNSLGESVPVAVVLTTLHAAITPAAPTNINVISVTNSSITLSFTDNATNEDGYVISWPENYNGFFCEGANLTICEVIGLASDTLYDLTIEAVTYTEVSPGWVTYYIASAGVSIQASTSP